MQATSARKANFDVKIDNGCWPARDLARGVLLANHCELA
jgi:hypothetical protein